MSKFLLLWQLFLVRVFHFDSYIEKYMLINVYIITLGNMTKMASTPIYDKTIQKFFL